MLPANSFFFLLAVSFFALLCALNVPWWRRAFHRPWRCSRVQVCLREKESRRWPPEKKKQSEQSQRELGRKENERRGICTKPKDALKKLVLASLSLSREREKRRHALWRLAAPRRGRRCGSSSNTVVVSLFDDGILIVLDRGARRPGVDEFSEFSDFVDFDRSVVVGALAVPGRSLALRGLPPLFGSIAHRWRLRNIFQSRLDWASDSRRRWLRLGERECESAILLLEFFVGVIGVGAGTVDD